MYYVEQEADVLEVIREVQPCRLLLAYAHTVYQYEFADFRIKESFSVELTNCSRPGSSEVPRNPLTRWDVSSIPANGIFLLKKLKNKNKNAQRGEND